MTNMLSTPMNFICPITHEIMQNPVLLVEDGHSYEKYAIEKWLEKNNTSPITNQQLKTKTFVMNYNLKSTIEEYCHQQNEINFRSFTLRRGRPVNKEWEKYPKLNIIISLLGPACVGKSCLALNAEYGQTLKNNLLPSTIGIDMMFFYLDQLFEDKYVVIIQVNDCPGDDKFESVSDRHFRNCHGAILVADTTKIEQFDRLEYYWYKQLCQKTLFDKVETVLACNKIDLLETNFSPSYREEFFKKVDGFISNYQIPVFNISAIRGDNVQAIFHHLISSILQNELLIQNLKDNQIKPKPIQISAIDLTLPLETTKKKKQSSCC